MTRVRYLGAGPRGFHATHIYESDQICVGVTIAILHASGSDARAIVARIGVWIITWTAEPLWNVVGAAVAGYLAGGDLGHYAASFWNICLHIGVPAFAERD